MTQGQEEEYVSCSEVMNVNENYDTIAVQIRGNNFVYSWTNYTTQEQGRPGNGGFPGGGGGMNEGNSDNEVNPIIWIFDFDYILTQLRD